MTTRSIISSTQTGLTNQLTSVYTNQSSAGSVLKSININGVGDPTIFNTNTGATEWTPFGSNINPFYQIHAVTGTGFGVPYSIPLSDNRVLMISLPHFQHMGGLLDYMGGNTLHTQVVEYQQPANKYVSYPIVNIPTPAGTAIFNAATYSLWSIPSGVTGLYGGPCVRGVALTPNVVVVAISQATYQYIIRLNISNNGNTVDISNYQYYNLSYFTGASNAFDLSTVPGDTTKVIFGSVGPSTLWNLQAFNIPTFGPITPASGLFSTGLTSSAYPFSMDRISALPIPTQTTPIVTTTASASAGTASVGFAAQSYIPYPVGSSITISGLTPTNFNGTWVVTACTTSQVQFALAGSLGPQTVAGSIIGLDNHSVYVTVGATAATTLQTQLVDFNASKGIFNLVGTASSLTSPGTIYGIQAVCLSSDATAQATIAVTGSTTPASFFTYRQNSLTQSLNTSVTTTLQHTTAKGINEVYNWGPNKAVFFGETGTLVSVDFNANIVNLIPSTQTTNTTRTLQLYFPFSSRPLYSIYDPGTILTTRVPQFYARTQSILPLTANASNGVATVTFTQQLPVTNTATTHAPFNTTPFSNGQSITISTTGTTFVSNTITNASSNTWTAITSNGATSAANAQVWVALSQSGATSYSSNGTSWSLGTPLSGAYNWTSLVSGNNTFVAVSNTIAAYSTNGSTWTAGGNLAGTVLPFVSVAYGNINSVNTFVAVANTSNSISVSTNNGSVWTNYPSVLPGSQNWSSVAYGSNTFVAVSSNNTVANIQSAVIAGTSGTFTCNTGSQLSVGMQVVVTGTLSGSGSITNYNSGTGNTYYITATNGSTAFTLGTTPGGAPITTTAGSTTGFTFNAQPTPIAWTPTSNVAAPWSAVTLPFNVNWSSVTYGNGRFVAISREGQVVWSTNGSIWNWSNSIPVLTQAVAAGAVWQNISFGNGYFLVTSGGPALWAAISIDGIQWSLITLPSAQNWVGSSFGTNSWIIMAGASFANTTGNTSVMSTFNTNPFNPINGIFTVTNSGNNFVQFAANTPFANTSVNTTAGVSTTITGLNTGTNVGALDFTRTYLPYGYDYGGNYFWNEQVSCFVVATGGRIYTMDTSGYILDEIDLNTLGLTQGFTSFNYIYGIKHLCVTPSGKITFAADYGSGYHASYGCTTTHNSLVNTLYCGAISALTDRTALSRSNLIASPTNIGAFLTSGLFPQLDGSDTVTFLGLQTIATPVVCVSQFTGTTWSTATATSVGSTSTGAWNVGFRPNFKLIQDNTSGPNYRIFGSTGTNTSSAYSILGISSTSYPFASFGSLSTSALNTGSTATVNGYGISFRSSTNYQVAAAYDPNVTNMRVYTSSAGRLNQSYITGYQTAVNANAQFALLSSSKYGATVAVNNTGPSQNIATAYIFDTINMSTPKTTLTTGLGNGLITTYPTGKLSWQNYGTSLDTSYTVSGQNDTARVFITLSSSNTISSNTDFYLTPQAPVGQSISTSQATNFRATDTYLVPPGYSIKMATDSPNSIAALLSVVEEI
jgi:hypothetical protein